MIFSYYPVYRLLTGAVFGAVRPLMQGLARLSGESPAACHQRLGRYELLSTDRTAGRPRIWLHAASVGEVGAAVGIVNALKTALPNCAVVVSTMSLNGRRVAAEKLDPCVTKILAPFDFVGSVRPALAFFRPDILVCLETEIWPNWLTEAQRAGVKTAIVNGRISIRSIRNYVRMRPLFQQILARMDALSMIRDEDAQRISLLGARPERISVNGNAKYDLLINNVLPAEQERFAKLLNLSGQETVFVAGSTRSSEEVVVLDAYDHIRRFFPDSLLIITPRHVERAYKIETLVRERGLACQLRTDLNASGRSRVAPVVIMDTIGELQSLYGVASIVFCGGSLVPKGGHNILEAAVWGKPVIYGPHMDDFLDAKELLEAAGGGFLVRNGNELAQTALFLLRHPEKAKGMGESARRAVMTNKGAAGRHAEVIQQVLRGSGFKA